VRAPPGRRDIVRRGILNGAQGTRPCPEGSSDAGSAAERDGTRHRAPAGRCGIRLQLRASASAWRAGTRPEIRLYSRRKFSTALRLASAARSRQRSRSPPSAMAAANARPPSLASTCASTYRKPSPRAASTPAAVDTSQAGTQPGPELGRAPARPPASGCS
jgi:hypothetical protein